MGRFSKPPPQFGQVWFKRVSTQVLQNVHSKVQIMASVELKGNDLLQCSHVGLISSIFFALGIDVASFLKLEYYKA
jgi:hypothetical protein